MSCRAIRNVHLAQKPLKQRTEVCQCLLRGLMYQESPEKLVACCMVCPRAMPGCERVKRTVLMCASLWAHITANTAQEGAHLNTAYPEPLTQWQGADRLQGAARTLLWSGRLLAVHHLERPSTHCSLCPVGKFVWRRGGVFSHQVHVDQRSALAHSATQSLTPCAHILSLEF